MLIFHPYWISTPTKPNQKKKSQQQKIKHYFLLIVQLLHILPWDLGFFSPFFLTLGNSRFINSPWSNIHENQPTLNKPSRLRLSSEGTHLVTQNAGHLTTSQKHRVREEIVGVTFKRGGHEKMATFLKGWTVRLKQDFFHIHLFLQQGGKIPYIWTFPNPFVSVLGFFLLNSPFLKEPGKPKYQPVPREQKSNEFHEFLGWKRGAHLWPSL